MLGVNSIKKFEFSKRYPLGKCTVYNYDIHFISFSYKTEQNIYLYMTVYVCVSICHVDYLFIALGDLAREFVSINHPDAVDNFECIVLEFIEEHGKGKPSFANVAGVLFYFKSNSGRTFGELANAAAKVSKMYPDKVAGTIR